MLSCVRVVNCVRIDVFRDTRMPVSTHSDVVVRDGVWLQVRRSTKDNS